MCNHTQTTFSQQNEYDKHDTRHLVTLFQRDGDELPASLELGRPRAPITRWPGGPPVDATFLRPDNATLFVSKYVPSKRDGAEAWRWMPAEQKMECPCTDTLAAARVDMVSYSAFPCYWLARSAPFFSSCSSPLSAKEKEIEEKGPIRKWWPARHVTRMELLETWLMGGWVESGARPAFDPMLRRRR